VADSESTSPLNTTTPFKPQARCSIANTTSDPHSQANHGCPALLNENRSVAGTDPVLRMYSPVRMCHPVSPSASNTLQPDPSANTQSRIARNRQSESEGTSRRGTVPKARIAGWTASTIMMGDGKPPSARR